uniref:Plus3 domain-containing protein n=1 Tax=Acrobeloides nanus TaxID=290746 RepID=A0A914EJ64_9BILA
MNSKRFANSQAEVFDDDIFLDEEDRLRLNMMSEKEREIEIFKRIEKREVRKAREALKQKLSEKNQSNDDDEVKKKKNHDVTNPEKPKKSKIRENFESNDPMAEELVGTSSSKKAKYTSSDEEMDMTYHHPSDVAKKLAAKKAVNELKNRRKEKKEAEEKRRLQAEKVALDIDDVFGVDSDEDAKTSSSTSSSPSRNRSRSFDRSSDHSRESSLEIKPEITSVSDLKRIRLSRYKLSLWCHYPFFNNLVVGCFVRVSVGFNQAKNQQTYRMCRVNSVVEKSKAYQLEKTRTNKCLRLQHGDDIKDYPMNVVSDREFTDSEFSKWMENMKKSASPLPTIEEVQQKEAEIREALTFKHTEQNVDYLVKQKARFNSTPANMAIQKLKLQNKLTIAEETGDIDAARRLQEEISEINERALKVDRNQNEKTRFISVINQKNRERMKNFFVEATKETTTGEYDEVDDPFTRKTGKMKVVTGVNKTKEKLVEDTGKLHKSSSAPNLTPLVKKKNKVEEDLKNAHDVDIEIDLKFPSISLIPQGKREIPDSPTQLNSSQSSMSTQPKKVLTLEEWKRRKGQ